MHDTGHSPKDMLKSVFIALLKETRATEKVIILGRSNKMLPR